MFMTLVCKTCCINHIILLFSVSASKYIPLCLAAWQDCIIFQILYDHVNSFRPYSECHIFWLGHVGHADIIWTCTFFELAHSEYVSQLGGRVLSAVCTQPLSCLQSALCVAMATVCEAEVETNTKEKPAFLSGRRNYFYTLRQPWISTGFWICVNDFFKKAAERMKEGGCVL